MLLSDERFFKEIHFLYLIFRILKHDFFFCINILTLRLLLPERSHPQTFSNAVAGFEIMYYTAHLSGAVTITE